MHFIDSYATRCGVISLDMTLRMVDKQFPCNMCGAIFPNRASCKNHVRNIHQAKVQATFPRDRVEVIKRSPEGEFKCICGKNFSLPDSVRRHAKTCMAMEGALGTVMNEGDGEGGVEEEPESDMEGGRVDVYTSVDPSYDFVGIPITKDIADSC